MFTGIIEEVGRVTDARHEGGNLRVRIEAELVSTDLGIGDSVAVSGCCLTVVATGEGAFEVELSRETVAKTAPRWHHGARVNLERAAALGSRLGGHIVSGHVDGVGEVLERRDAPGAYVLRVRGPERLSSHLVPKGSITVDGVSLTLVDVGGPAGNAPTWPAHEFSLWLIPHTLAVTTLDELEAGSKVNLETDVVAKYVERLHALEASAATDAATGNVPNEEEADHV